MLIVLKLATVLKLRSSATLCTKLKWLVMLFLLMKTSKVSSTLWDCHKALCLLVILSSSVQLKERSEITCQLEDLIWESQTFPGALPVNFALILTMSPGTWLTIHLSNLFLDQQATSEILATLLTI